MKSLTRFLRKFRVFFRAIAKRTLKDTGKAMVMDDPEKLTNEHEMEKKMN